MSPSRTCEACGKEPPGFSTVPKTADLWTVGIAKKGDLVPAVTRPKD